MSRLILLLLLAGCPQVMEVQPRYDPFEPSAFFADGTSARPLVEGTVARLQAAHPQPPTDWKLLKRGREAFGIYCSLCHGMAGDGAGVIVQRGFPAPPTYHSDRLRRLSDRQIYEVISHGYGIMYGYADRVAPPDRWAIVAYIRALQFSQHAPAHALPPDVQKRLPPP